MATVTCLRCGAPITKDPEACSVCAGPLCLDCWEGPGHCGLHPGQDERDRRSQDHHRRLGYDIPEDPEP